MPGPRPDAGAGIFDRIFTADVVGSGDVYEGSNRHPLHRAAQIPVNEPLQLAAPIALAAEHRHHRLDLLRAPLPCRPPTQRRARSMADSSFTGLS